jgi:DNA-binding PadR family transcriptional regulator
VPRKNRANPLALAVLVSLYEKAMHPYEIAQTLRERAKHESVRLNYGSLYAVVEALERRGLIEARETVREGKRPERTIYGITDAGSREMTDWLTEMIGVPAKEYPEFMAGLSFIAALTPDDALAALRLRATALEMKLARIRGGTRAAADAGLPRLFMVESEFEEQLTETELHFVNGLVKDQASGDLEGLDMWRSFHTDGTNPLEGVVFRFEST